MSEARPPRPSAGEGTTPAGFLTEYDLYLFREGTLYQLFDRLGAHPAVLDLVKGTRFAVWAPNARRVSVIGDFNGWRAGQNDLASKGDSGLWEGFVPGVGHGTLYKYVIESQVGGQRLEKADPIGFATELRPRTASKVWDLGGYAWGDAEWMGRRSRAQGMDRPISVYEVHLGSWRRVPEEGDRWLTYQEAATQLAAYALDMGYTHVELMPITEHPFDGSWGYQTLGFFAPTSRFGTPHDFMAFVDTLHRAGIGVILDWVPAHFPSDAHGLAQFDGTHLYEHSDPKLGRHPDWGSLIFNYGRTEVQNFLIASALFWIERYHIDGLRIDAVASMLYLDYSRKEGEWIPNAFGGRENLAAIAFLKRLNEAVYGMHPDTLTVAEESTSWPAVSRPTYVGGLGFGYKWDMGWMHDTLQYMGYDPVHRRFHHNDLTFRMLYAWHENFMLPLSHDEVVHGKSSLLGRMPGDPWQKFANLRLLHANQYGQPGKKLLFMGGEIAQWDEWQFARSLPWHLLQWEPHQGVQRLVRDLNRMYREEPALHERESDPNAFAWIDCSDTDASIVSFVRYARDGGAILWVFNYTPVPREGYRLGVPAPGRWQELLNTDSTHYGGTGMGNQGGRESEPIAIHGHAQSVVLTLPPLAAVVLKGGISSTEG